MSTTPAVDSIRAWQDVMGSSMTGAYADMEVNRARKANAPDGAIYERDGVWRNVDDVTNPRALEILKSHGVDVSVAEGRIIQAGADRLHALDVLYHALDHYGLSPAVPDDGSEAVTFNVRATSGEVQGYRAYLTRLP